MTRIGLIWLALLCAILIAAPFGCGDDDDDDDDAASGDTDTDTDSDADGDSDTDADVPAHTITATLTVPDEFAATPVLIGAAIIDEDQYPLGPDDVPAATTGLEMSPDIGPDMDYSFQGSNEGLAGDYYIAWVLFVEGGGAATQEPVVGVDWAGSTDDPVTLGADENNVDLGTIELHVLEEEADGGV